MTEAELRDHAEKLVTLASVEGGFAISDRPFARTVIRYLPPKVV